MENKSKRSFWIGYVAYLIVLVAPPALKLAGQEPFAGITWLVATCLIWGPALLLVVVIILGAIFKAGTGHSAHE
jgi:hypothetical protein